ncbi:hypothetical protein [Nocardia sp. NBC_01329]|uniref:hypothetical protein n=1 Tax=Nocardia sp. NBC_01329 TaxID=2903594 RepID=UPI002E15BFE4|nr:hypothetical protein OG405_08365 [Nocardia sp. NBC_01329]
MNVSARLRRTSAILLMAVLLIAPILDCALHRADQHTHPARAVAELAFGSSHTPHLHGMSGHPDGHCDQHMIHCLEKSVLPSGVATFLSLLWTAFLGTATVGAIALVLAGALRSRGPPVADLPVSSGRAILTNFCISRR